MNDVRILGAEAESFAARVIAIEHQLDAARVERGLLLVREREVRAQIRALEEERESYIRAHAPGAFPLLEAAEHRATEPKVVPPPVQPTSTVREPVVTAETTPSGGPAPRYRNRKAAIAAGTPPPAEPARATRGHRAAEEETHYYAIFKAGQPEAGPLYYLRAPDQLAADRYLERYHEFQERLYAVDYGTLRPAAAQRIVTVNAEGRRVGEFVSAPKAASGPEPEPAEPVRRWCSRCNRELAAGDPICPACWNPEFSLRPPEPATASTERRARRAAQARARRAQAKRQATETELAAPTAGLLCFGVYLSGRKVPGYYVRSRTLRSATEYARTQHPKGTRLKLRLHGAESPKGFVVQTDPGPASRLQEAAEATRALFAQQDALAQQAVESHEPLKPRRSRVRGRRNASSGPEIPSAKAP